MFVVREKRVRYVAVHLLLLAMWAVNGTSARRPAPVVSYEDSQYEDVSPAEQRPAAATYDDDDGVKIEKKTSKEEDEDVWQASGLNDDDKSLFDVDVDDTRKEHKNKMYIENYDLRHKSKEPKKRIKFRSKEKSSSNFEDRGKKHHSKKYHFDDSEHSEDDQFHDISRNKKKSRKSDKKRSKKHNRDHKYKPLHDSDEHFDDTAVIKESRRDKVKELEEREMEDGLDVRDIDGGDISEIRNPEHRPRKRLSENEQFKEITEVTMTNLGEFRRTPKNVRNSTSPPSARVSYQSTPANTIDDGEGIAVDVVNKFLESSHHPLHYPSVSEFGTTAIAPPLQQHFDDKLSGIVDWRLAALTAVTKKPQNSRDPMQQRSYFDYSYPPDKSPLEVVIRPRTQVTRSPRSTVEVMDLKAREPSSRVRERAREVIRRRLIDGTLEEPRGGDDDPLICDSIDEALLETAHAPSLNSGLLMAILCPLFCFLQY